MNNQAHLAHNKLRTFNNIIFDAIAEREPLQDVHAITLKGEYAKQLETMAVRIVIDRGAKLTRKNVMTEMNKLFDNSSIYVQEAVIRNKHGLFAVVNADTIDDVASARVFELISEAIDQISDGCGAVYFGERVSFTRQEIPWLNFH